MTFKKAEMAKILGNRLSMSETDPLRFIEVCTSKDLITKEGHVRFYKRRGADRFFLILIGYNLLLLPVISFGLTHYWVKAELHCTAAKLKGRFLMKMNA